MSVTSWGPSHAYTPTEVDWRGPLDEIAKPEFDYRLNVVSGASALFRAASQEPSVKTLYRAMITSGEARERAFNRLAEYANLDIDLRFANPNDTAMAIILWLAFFADAQHAQVAAAIVDRAPKGWYSKKLARWILDPRPQFDTGDSEYRARPDATASLGSSPGYQIQIGRIDHYPKGARVVDAPVNGSASSAPQFSTVLTP